MGKLMIKGMKSDNETSYSGGTIWDPEDNETYSSKMNLKGEALDVEGCVTIICSGQHWTRVKQRNRSLLADSDPLFEFNQVEAFGKRGTWNGKDDQEIVLTAELGPNVGGTVDRQFPCYAKRARL